MVGSAHPTVENSKCEISTGVVMARYLIAGGGTGGHIYPGLAVAEAVREVDSAAWLDFACTGRPIDRMILAEWEGAIVDQPVEPFIARPVGLVKFLRGQWRSRDLIRGWIREHKIEGVLGLGGFGSSSAMAVGAKMGLRTAFLNPDYVPGKANQWLSKYSDKIFVQWEETGQYFNRPVDVVGVPLRRTILSLAGQERAAVRRLAAEELGLSLERKTLVVMGGSTGARSLNKAVVKVLLELSERMGEAWQVLHILGKGDFEAMKDAYAGAAGGERIKAIAYLDRMELAWSMADAAVCRAGAITVAELAAVGIPSVLLPYPYHKDNHQAKNGAMLVKAGGAVLVEDDKEAGERTVGELRAAMEGILFDDDERMRMIEAARSLRRLDAAERVGRWLIGRD
jgi:UDP-N-acetylglucosamine--N-acetylmuramyl-(pentapeptide) pyrophosphoryl-undecaprenol N-acetylglucosamine transferase